MNGRQDAEPLPAVEGSSSRALGQMANPAPPDTTISCPVM